MPKRLRRQKSIVDSASVLNAGPFHVVGGLHKEEEKSGGFESGTAVERHDDGLPYVCYREYDGNVTLVTSDDVRAVPDILHEDVQGSDLTTIKSEPDTASIRPQNFSRAEGLIELLQKERSDLLAALRNTYELAMSLQQEVAVKAGGTMSERAAATLMHARWKILQAEGKMR